MVKADLSRDYYGDLELPPNADVADIKKQFKKLALTYHPDRNPGRESEVTAKFQKIQSAHEVLIDPTERAKYDANRIRVSSSSFRNTYSGGQASGVRGNPWANAGAQWAPPPKPPTARNRAQPPPPSTGAGRYAKFTPPNASAYQAAQEGPQARKAQYEAWDRTRHQNQTEHGPGKTWKAPQPPPRGTPTSGRQESNAQSQTRPPRSQPGFDEFRDSTSSHGRSQSTNASNRKGFMPNTPGGDEPPAPRGAYSTQRDKPTVAPEPPPRRPPPATTENPRPSTGRTDPLKKFRMDPPTMEERVSTPYATHGGEKFNPFESAAAGINRSKSTRERSEGFGKDNFPRAGSDTNLKSKNGTPHRARSFADRKSHAPRPSYSESLDTDSSSDEPIQMNRPTPRASARRSNGASPRTTKQAGSTTDPETQTTSKQSRIQQMRQWMKENPGQEPPPNGFGADGPPLRSGQPTPKANGEPSIFSFNLNNDSFTKTQPPKTNGFSNSAENISTKFTPEDWDGKFEAGGTYFQPEKVSSTPQRPRSQSNSRARGRSPIKVQPMFSMPSRSEEQTPIESPGGTKFSAQDWAETFKPQTFMPPPMTPRTGPARKRSLKPTMGGNAAVVDDGDSSDEKPLFTGRKSASPPKASPPIIGSPEPMDVDTPPVSNTVPQFAKPNGKLNTEHLKRPAASASASPVDSELKVAFEDLKVKDIISTLAMPTPPLGPSPPVTDKDIPSRAAYDDYLHRYEKYMQEWDRFNAKFLLHMVARKNQNDDLKDKRWADDKGLETYRMGLKEDQAVMLKWAEHTTVHEAVVKCFVIMKERMQNGDVAADSRRPRKKTH